MGKSPRYFSLPMPDYEKTVLDIIDWYIAGGSDVFTTTATPGTAMYLNLDLPNDGFIVDILDHLSTESGRVVIEVRLK